MLYFYFSGLGSAVCMLQLEVINGKDTGKCIRFQQSVVHIGTDPGNDFQLTDAEVSEYHGKFTCNHEAGHYAYCDLQSKRGSRIKTPANNVLLFSHQMPQSMALAGEILLSVGQTVIQCRPIQNSEAQAETVKPRRVAAISMHGLQPSSDTEILQFLLDTSTLLTSRTTYQSVMLHLSQAILQHLPHANHVALWRRDAVKDIFTCAFERSRNNDVTPSIVTQNELRSALNSRNVELYASGRNKRGNAIVAPLMTANREIGVLIVDTAEPAGMSNEDLDCISRVVGMAAYALERTYYNADLSNVFDGFIRAIIAVMDARDPATAGHSLRVARYTLYLAQAIHASQLEVFQNISFSHNHIEELRFAALLHDIGKVVLRREILLKSAKLKESDLKHLIERLDLFAAWFETQSPEKLGSKYRTPQQFEHYREIVTRVVQADVHPTDEDKRYLDEMTQTYITPCPDLPLLNEEEHECLLIPFGTLSRAERHEIQKHALISWQYLSQIAWPQRWANVPVFVLQHHEKLNGTGYPYGISGDQILLQSRMITVCDIFDAMTGGDRSYKTRHSFGDAAQFLMEQANSGALDRDIVEIFIDKVIPQISDPDLYTGPGAGISTTA